MLKNEIDLGVKRAKKQMKFSVWKEKKKTMEINSVRPVRGSFYHIPKSYDMHPSHGRFVILKRFPSTRG